MIIGSVITIVLTSIILRYVLELEEKNCECAKVWQHKFIKYFAPVVIVFALIPLFISSDQIRSSIRSNVLVSAIYVIYSLIALVYYINLVLYFLKLRYSMCACARDWKQYGLLYPVIGFAIILLIVVIVIFIQALGLLPALSKRLTGKKSKNNSAKELISELNNTLNKKAGRSTKSSSKKK